MTHQNASSKDATFAGPPPAMTGNLLLAAMAEREQIAPLLERFPLDQEATIYELGDSITHYYFPVQGVTSMVVEMQGGIVEVGTVGPEGMIGLSALLGVPTMTARVFTQSQCTVDRVTVGDLERIMTVHPGVRMLLLRYAHAFFEELSQTVACNRLHTLEERCARWLLMTHDRTDTDVMHLKQRFLAYMLGVHRPAVSLAAGALQKAGIIRYSRGSIRIVDRAALESASCECYERGRNAFARARLNERVGRGMAIDRMDS